MTDTSKRNWDEEARTWDERVETRRYADCAFESLLTLSPEVIGSLEGARVLDFGCGTGLRASTPFAWSSDLSSPLRSPSCR